MFLVAGSMPVALRHKRLAYPGADDTDDTAAEQSRAEQRRWAVLSDSRQGDMGI